MSSVQRDIPPVLSDGVVSLRAPRPEDAEDVTTGCQDPECQLWTVVPSPYTRADADEWLGRLTSLDTWWQSPVWAVTILPSDRWSGSIGLRPAGAGGVDVGYLLAPWARGFGHATRALRLACAWAFAALDVQVVTWAAYVGNVGSLQTARHAGFQVADHAFRGYLEQRGERRDAWIGTLSPDDLVTAARLGDARSRFLGPELTRRETDVLRQMTLGKTNRSIATDLGISENTVKNHVRSILEKLQAKSRSEAIVTSLRQGLTTLT